MKTLLKTFVVFSLLVVSIPAGAQNALPMVVSVGDGNTLRFRQEGKTITISTIRLGCIDSPELAQKAWGERARNKLGSYESAGTAVQIREIDRDRLDELLPNFTWATERLIYS